MTRNLRRLTVSAVTLVAFAAGSSGAGANHSAKEHVSLGTPTGGNGVAEVFFDATTADGSSVFFDTDEQLTSGDTDANFDLYQRRFGTTTLLSTAPGAGNGAFDIFFSAASSDGTRAFFETDERLTPLTDTDSSFDVYERSGGTTTVVSTGPAGGNGVPDVTFDAISKDGTHVFFETDERLVDDNDGIDDDNDAETDLYERTGGTTKLVSTGPAGGNGPNFVSFGGVSDDGTRAFFETDEQLTTDDHDNSYDVYERSGGTTTLVSIGPSGGNAAIDASYRDVSGDGTHVFFHTAEQLVSPDDGDAQTDVYARSGATTTLISTGPGGGNGAIPAAYEGTSRDGTRVFFSTDESLTGPGPPTDSDGRRDIYRRQGGTTDLVSTGPAGGNSTTFDADFMGASLNGSRAYIRTEESLVGTDSDTGCAGGQGPECRDIYEWSGGTTTQVSSGGNGAFDASFAAVSLDGQRVFFDTRESLNGSDMDGSVDVYERFGGATTLISSGVTGGNGAFTAFLFPNGLSDDGTRAFFDTRESLMSSDADTSFDVYGADVAGYPRPLAASPLLVSLVPAYSKCIAPNRTHGPPLASPSCNPPSAVSGQATMGTSDANGANPGFVGSVRYRTLVGVPGPPEDSNVRFTASLNDVRCRPTGSRCGTANAAGPADYNGELRSTVNVRMTDKWNGTAPGGGPDSATVQDLPIAVSLPCVQSGSTATGSSCSLTTTVNAFIPGIPVKDTKRAVWELGQVQVYDGGADGDGDTPGDNTLYAVQGLFVP
jgi:hypothetical protein